MKFGFTAPPVGAQGLGDAELYRHAVEDASYGQELGYDSVWLLEHHFTPYFPHPDLVVILSHLAAHCPGLGLGAAVIVVPWHHPLRLTEQIAMLSLLSSGDLYLGLGRGTARYEFERLDVEMEHTRDIFRESVEILQKGLAGKPFSYSGRHYSFPETLVRPIADPERIKLYGAIGSPDSARVMAELGLPMIHTSNFPDHKAVEFVETWQARIGATDQQVREAAFPMHCNPCIVAPTDTEARELAHVYTARFATIQMEHYETRDDYWKDIPGYEVHSRFFANLARMVEDSDFRDKYLNTQLVGAPETVIRRLEVLQNTVKIGHVICAHAQYDMEQDLRRRSMKLFAEQVIPHFRKGSVAA